MINRKNLIATAVALSIGAATFAAAAPAQAASGLGFASLENSVDANVTKVGRKGGRGGHGRGGHRGGRHHGHHGKHHGRHHGGHWGHGYHGGCFFKTVKEWDPYEGGWVYYKKHVCY